MDRTDTLPSSTRRWVQGLYFLALLIFLQPFLETGAGTWPPLYRDAGWRFGAAGVLSTMLPTVAFGLLVGAVAAFLLGHRRTLRGIGWLSLVMGVFFVLLAGGFVLDALQMRKIVRPQARGAFDMAVIKAVATTLLAVVALVALGLGALRASALARAPIPRRRAAGEGLLVGHPPPTEPR